MRFIKPQYLNTLSFILDVRTLEEYKAKELKTPHIHKELKDLNPLEFIKENHIGKDDTINIICSSGARASQAAEMFENAGIDNVAVVIGGIVEAEYQGMEIIRH